MRLLAAPLAATIVFLLMLNVPGAHAQGDAGVMKVETRISMTGLTALDGSGTAKLTYTGECASALRLQIINTYDMGNQVLDPGEVRAFLTNVSDDIVGKTYWGITIKSTTNFTLKSDQYIMDHTKGLALEGLSSTDPITFSIGFEGSGSSATKQIQIAQGVYDTFATAVAMTVDYRHNGTMVVKTRVSTYGLGSLTKPHLDGGKLTAVRLPWGEVLWYSYSGIAGNGETIDETLAYETFSVVESQLIGAVVLFFGSLFILRTPGRRFDKYEKLHPRKFRKYAKPLMSVRLSAYGLVAVLAVLYLFPYIFSVASPSALLYSAYLYVLVPIVVVVELVLSRMMYDKAALSIPEESIIEVKQAIVQPAEGEGEGEMLCKICYTPIEAGLDLFQCNCGLTMHTSCAEKAQNCPNCGDPLVQLRTRSIQCRACGETFLYSGDEDSYSIQCTKCGAFQEEIRPGKNYLIIDADPRNAFMMIRALALSNRPAMCLTTSFPGKIRAEYDLKDVAIKWFSDSTTDIDNVNPKDLETDAMETVSTFLMTTKESGVLIDGIETLIEINGFDKGLAFIKKLNDLAAIHGSTILLSLNRSKLPADQFKAISDEFDEIHDYQ